MAGDSINAKDVEECESLVIKIPPVLPHAEWRDYCIYRVPQQLRKVNEEAYTPKLLSIGPFHHIHPEDDLKDDMEKYKLHLKDMEKHKLKYLDDFLKRKRSKEISQVDLLKIIQNKEGKIRDSYSEDCELKSGPFVQMILLDAVFIIELFLKDEEKEEEEAKRKGEDYCEKESDYILSKPWLSDGILHDLILLENQLPFFILVELYMSACCDQGQQTKEQKEDLKKEANRRFVELSRKYFESYDKDKEPKSIIEKEVKHFTDLLRYLFCPREMEKLGNDDIKVKCGSKQKSQDSSKKPEEESFGIRYCATKLDKAGLKFNEVKDDRRLLDIQPPRPGVLGRIPCFGRPMEVPKLEIDDYTETLFRNLMALEQCLYPSHTCICHYVFLLDQLIDTEKDMDLLVQKKVINNRLGSNKIAAELINKLCDNIGVSESPYFDDIGENLNEHYEFTLNHTMATLKREYFPNVFRGTATGVGLIVLGFTFWNFLRPFVV